MKLMELSMPLGAREFQLRVFTENVPAIKLYQKLGFEIEGHFKKQNLIKGEFKDDFTMALFV